MDGWVERNFDVLFPLFFLAMWLTVTTILSVLSGWFRLMAQFPNQEMEPLLRLRRQSGSMGVGVSMQGILTLSVCATGLRVGIQRVFGPFCRDFFVPWAELSVTRKSFLFSQVAKLQFGNPVIGSLTIPAHVADSLARAELRRWPELGPFPERTRRDTLRRLLIQWAVPTCFAALFFTLAPLAMAPSQNRPPIAATILFPAIVFGIFTVVGYFRERR